MKQFLCAVLALLLLLCAGCDSSTSAGGENGNESGNEAFGDPDFILAENGVCDYIIIRSENASKEEIALSVELRNLLKEQFGVTVELKDDFVREGTNFVAVDKEICIGATNREESQHATEGLKLGDYRILQEGTRVAIAFGSAESGREALDWFIANCMFPEQKLIGVPTGLDHTVHKEYPFDTITVAGKDITEYTIVGGADFTSVLWNKIAELTGISVKTSTSRSKKGPMIYCEQLDGIGPEEQVVRVTDAGVVAGTSGEYYQPEEAVQLLLDMLDKSGGTIPVCDRKEKIVNPDMVFITDAEVASLRAKTDERIKSIRATNETPKITGTTYYVAPDGKDSNAGTSPDAPWQTLTKVSSAVLKSGDSVLFQRGGIYRGQLKTQMGVTYSAYGTGDKPKLYGSPENSAGAEKWVETDVKNVWRYYKVLSEDVGTIVFNDGEEHAIKCILETGGIDLTTREPFATYQDLKYDKHFYQVKDYGALYLYSDKGNPGTRWTSIEMNVKHNVIGLSADNVTIDNLCVKYGGAHGIGGGTRKNITVQNCEIGWIGGSIQGWGVAGQAATHATRYGNGVELYGGCENYKITNCYFYQIYDAAVTHQYDGSGKLVEMKNVEYSGNVMEYCNYSIEYFLSNIETGNKSLISNVVIRDNLMWYAGCGLCEQRADKTQGAHIKSWNHTNPTAESTYLVENNLFAFSRNMLLHIYSAFDGSDPIMSGNTYIQNINGDIGIFGVRKPDRLKYDARVKDYINETLGDTKATVRFAHEPVYGK